MSQYDYQKIEKKWQKRWEESGIYKAEDYEKGKKPRKGKPRGKNFYHLVMFPYPSGDLHIGHWYNFAPADVYARFKKMSGFNVMSPIGFDAFGLPAENAAIKRKIHPRDWTYKNIKTMIGQLKSIGAMYDWSRQIITAAPEYYKWTQWIFLQMHKNGLAYKKKAAANWCPKCHTVLANEQVVEGKCERCGAEVVQREIEQWLFRITKYADRLLKDLDKLDWPEKTKIMQRNWIGRSEGATIKFEIRSTKSETNSKFKIQNSKHFLEVFTTRIDTIFGCTYVVVAPEHQIISNLKSQISNLDEVKNYIKEAKRKLERERLAEDKQKTGIELKGAKAINPATNKEVPIFVSDYVLAHYGTGAIMAVPAYDERDLEFAEKFNLPIIKAPLVSKEEIIKKLGAKKIAQYRVRDWLISRQRYWGTPIPIVYCEKCGIVLVLEKDLPVLLPNVKNYLPTEEGKSPLAHSEKFVNAKCPKCGGAAKRETDTMDTFVCSSWYYLAYAFAHNLGNQKSKIKSQKYDKENIFIKYKKLIKAWLPVDMYIGGAEHSVLHLLYSRFFTKALKDFGYLNFSEPFASLRHQGIILGPDGQKMSKSRGNVIDPDELVKNFGADAVRLYLCFMGEYSQGGPWNPTGIMGVSRFLQKIWKFKSQIPSTKSQTNSKIQIQNSKLEILLHKTIKKVSEDIENFKFNTAISALMILLNEMEKEKNLHVTDYELLVTLLSPFAPHITEEIWHNLGHKNFIHSQKWPEYDPKKIKEEIFILAVQINGKLRDTFEVPIGISQEQARMLTLERENVKKRIGNNTIKKVVFVPNKLINLVI